MIADLTREVHELNRKLLLAPGEKVQIKQNWYREMESKYGKEGADFAYSILTISQERAELHIEEFNLEKRVEVTNVDQSKHVGGNLTDFSQSAGGNQTGVVGGIGNEVLMGDVTAYNTIVDRQASINAHNAQLGNALKQGRQAIEGLQLDPDEKRELLSAYGKLTEEVAKEKPKPGLVQMFWNTISTFTAKAAPLVQIGVLLAQAFGIIAHPAAPKP